MKRRDFLKLLGATVGSAILPKLPQSKTESSVAETTLRWDNWGNVVLKWDRALSPDEISTLYKTPYVICSHVESPFLMATLFHTS